MFGIDGQELSDALFPSLIERNLTEENRFLDSGYMAKGSVSAKVERRKITVRQGASLIARSKGFLTHPLFPQTDEISWRSSISYILGFSKSATDVERPNSRTYCQTKRDMANRTTASASGTPE